MSIFQSGCNYAKLKSNLRLCIQRLKLLEKKKTELAQKSRKEIADYIQAGKEDRARIRVEHIVREDYLVEAMEILELFCDLLLARFGIIKDMKTVDVGLEEAISSLIWASPRLQADIPEFKEVTKQLSNKYSPEYAEMCKKNENEKVNAKLFHKLSIYAPPKSLIENYMIEISKSYNVPFEPDPTALLEGEIPSVSKDLIDLEGNSDSKRFPPGPGGGSGGSFPMAIGGPPLGPASYPPTQNPASYPPQDPAYPPSQQNSGSYAAANAPRLPSYDTATQDNHSPPPAYNGNNAAPLPPKIEGSIPDLPAVPNTNLSVPPSSFGASAGGEDVDFDDLTRRFEELKKKK